MLDRARVRAPELDGASGWVGVDSLSLARLRGKVVLLDFWTLACVNCQRVVEELRGLERRFADALVVVGVHSPKFPHEHDHGAVRDAVARHRIEHPVLDDPAMATWDAYAVKAWPTLVLIDADGRVALTVSGEGHAVTLASAIEALIDEARERGTLRRGRLEDVADAADADAAVGAVGTGELAFPGKVAIEDGATRAPRIAIADTGHDRVLVGTLNGEIEHELTGFYQPQGVRFDGVGDTASLLVCETGADRVWRVWLDGRPRELITDQLKAPWDVVVWHGHVVVAEAGRHRLWAVDRAGELQVLAGTGAEGLHDGPGLEAVLAQPSALAVTADGDLAFLDAEASALRVLRAGTFAVRTLAGAGLFAWGDEDGDGDRARLQHPLGLTLGPNGELYVADTFNDVLRVWRGAHLWTVPVRDFTEPGGLAALPDGRLLVADTGRHRIVRVDPLRARTKTLAVGRPGSSDTPADQPEAIAGTLVEPAGTTVTVQLDLDQGDDHLDPAGGPPVRVRATASEEGLLREPTSWTASALPVSIDLALGREAGSGRITLELLAATCGPDACRLRRTQRAYDVLLT
ncbi:MAG TPA: thioredoxin-like domain-containing protein [Baekduia sp.]|uniref:thioredoxin-like domain-containing protein n=1 Tax=Baekduia sp. TaxID=2600305 RepID=UPI002D76692C|nr:thioredoxin-like domain-containing protein [Baekduia sp.]HET6505916.1 thioredoxin-like domain-containing protein [Baekduia sp.]